MTSLKKIIFLFLVTSVVLSCKEETKLSPESNQMKKVMVIHDEVMPKMGKISSLIGQLRKKIDSDKGGAIEKKAMEDLQDANKSMMDWMQGFGSRFDYDEINGKKDLNEEKKQWLNEAEEKVKIVKEKINTSIANAEAILGEK